jgi:thiamine-monophosphate kinase
LGRPSEDELIQTFFAPLAGPGGLGLRDDAAVLTPPVGQDLVLTTDIVIAGIHFLPDDPAALVARKALRVNLSDLAGKGAAPSGFLLGLALPDSWTTDWLAAFAAGLGEDSSAFACPLLGGDTSRTPGPLMISITAFGSVPRGGMVPRGGVAAGDRIYVSGTIGDAALGLALRKGRARAFSSEAGAGSRRENAILRKCRAILRSRWIGKDSAEPAWPEAISPAAAGFLEDRYLLPQPRLVLGETLRRSARAAMDVSDGLAGDLAKMLRLTGTTAEIRIADVPLSDAAREAIAHEPGLVETILCGGDDYEILCAVPPERGEAFEAAAGAVGVPVRAIGTAVAGTEAPEFKDRDGRLAILGQRSFQHF